MQWPTVSEQQHYRAAPSHYVSHLLGYAVYNIMYLVFGCTPGVDSSALWVLAAGWLAGSVEVNVAFRPLCELNHLRTPDHGHACLCRHEGEGSAFALLKVGRNRGPWRLVFFLFGCWQLARTVPMSVTLAACTLRPHTLLSSCSLSLSQARGWATALVAGEAGTSYRQAGVW